jgi:biotin synthase
VDEVWIRERVLKGFTPADLRALLEAGDEEFRVICREAVRVREARFGRTAYLRAVIEFSNRCRCSCLYCGMRLGNRGARGYELGADEIVETAATARKNGIRTFFLQAAESETYEAGWLTGVISRISAMGMEVLLCVGFHGVEELDAWRRAGAGKFILKHETSDPDLFSRMKPGFSLRDRIAMLKTLRERGFSVGSGTLLGLPGQTMDSLVGDLVLMKELAVEMSSVSIFIPASGTPLENQPCGDPELGLRFVAAMRLHLGNTLIPATSTFQKLLPDGQFRCFQAGANVITVNMTPPVLRDEYTLYTDRFYVGLAHARETIARAGLTESSERDGSCRR